MDMSMTLHEHADTGEQKTTVQLTHTAACAVKHKQKFNAGEHCGGRQGGRRTCTVKAANEGQEPEYFVASELASGARDILDAAGLRTPQVFRVQGTSIKPGGEYATTKLTSIKFFIYVGGSILTRHDLINEINIDQFHQPLALVSSTNNRDLLQARLNIACLAKNAAIEATHHRARQSQAHFNALTRQAPVRLIAAHYDRLDGTLLLFRADDDFLNRNIITIKMPRLAVISNTTRITEVKLCGDARISSDIFGGYNDGVIATHSIAALGGHLPWADDFIVTAHSGCGGVREKIGELRALRHNDGSEHRIGGELGRYLGQMDTCLIAALDYAQIHGFYEPTPQNSQRIGFIASKLIAVGKARQIIDTRKKPAVARFIDVGTQAVSNIPLDIGIAELDDLTQALHSPSTPHKHHQHTCVGNKWTDPATPDQRRFRAALVGAIEELSHN